MIHTKKTDQITFSQPPAKHPITLDRTTSSQKASIPNPSDTLEAQETPGIEISVDEHSSLSDNSETITEFKYTQSNDSEAYTNFNDPEILSKPPRYNGQDGQKTNEGTRAMSKRWTRYQWRQAQEESEK